MAKSILQFLIPRNNSLLNFLNEECDNLHSMSLLLHAFSHEEVAAKKHEYISKITHIHNENQQLNRKLFQQLSDNLILPFDREDVFNVAANLKSLSAKLDSLGRHCELYNCGPHTIGLEHQIELLEKSFETIAKIISLLDNLKKRKEIIELTLDLQEFCKKIDLLCDTDLLHTFETTDDVRVILINFETYEFFASISKKMRHLNLLAEGILVKYS
ncbi:MAG: DUF47 domain-containing protein [Flavobacteriia bacterium]|jgi:uncharacterized protein Yka (UPF0111/DUF47 family)